MTRKSLVLIAAVAALGIGAAAWVALPRLTGGGAPQSTQAESFSAPMAAEAQTAADVDTSTIVEMTLGAADAPVEVIEYASFTCPHCADFHTNVFPQLKADYVDTGKVRFVYREVYFDRLGLWASMVARCGGEERFFGIVEMLYGQQAAWVTAGEPADIVEALRRIGRTAGLTNEQLDACLSDGQTAQTLVAWYQENKEEHDVRATPSFVIDGEKVSNMPFADFAALLDGKLGD